jgi:alkaline phosphatase D
MPTTRREFLEGAAALTLAGMVGQAVDDPIARLQEAAWEPLAIQRGIKRIWLGRDFWANRLGDWQLNEGRLECLAGDAGDQVRTVSLLPREMIGGGGIAFLSVKAGLLEVGGRGGFFGFLIGAGAGELDYRATALVQKASGVGGGIMCVFESDGRVRFRDHRSEETPLMYPDLGTNEHVKGEAPKVGEEFELGLMITPRQAKFDVSLIVRKAGKRVASGSIQLADTDLIGGIALVSSPLTGGGKLRAWFSDIKTHGQKIAARPERAIGPILGAKYSLNANVLKLSAQLMPIGETEPQEVALEIGGKQVATAKIEAGFSVRFRVENWDATREHEYRIVYGDSSYGGRITLDPVDEPSLRIAHLSCTMAAARSLEGGGGNRPELPKAQLLGRYTRKNLYFPYEELVKNVAAHKPHLLVFAGDQFYEGSPTRRDNSDSPTLDYLYKWYLWVWAFAALTRNTPTIIQTDDHDVYHGNLWGNGGRPAPKSLVMRDGQAVDVRDPNRGGYRCTGDWVNLVQRTQCGHNPDPFDAAPVEQGIETYYSAFKFGGVSFAILEDRKFKTAPIQGEDLDVHEAQLLGERQEKFLEEWGKDWDGVWAKVCLTQTLFACVQTSPTGRAMLDWDSNGHPKLQRDRAIELLKKAKAIVLAGDQHIASVVWHGLENFTDGVLQYTGPAGASSWQRWFEPARQLLNARGKHTGDFVDAFGNKVRVLAVANPKVTFAEYRQVHKGRGQGLGDRSLKSEGYGIITVDKQKKEFLIECWKWDQNEQFEGWPVRVPFAHAQ